MKMGKNAFNMKNYVSVQMVMDFFGALGKNQLIFCSPDFTIF